MNTNKIADSPSQLTLRKSPGIVKKITVLCEQGKIDNLESAAVVKAEDGLAVSANP